MHLYFENHHNSIAFCFKNGQYYKYLGFIKKYDVTTSYLQKLNRKNTKLLRNSLEIKIARLYLKVNRLLTNKDYKKFDIDLE